MRVGEPRLRAPVGRARKRRTRALARSTSQLRDANDLGLGCATLQGTRAGARFWVPWGYSVSKYWACSTDGGLKTFAVYFIVKLLDLSGIFLLGPMKTLANQGWKFLYPGLKLRQPGVEVFFSVFCCQQKKERIRSGSLTVSAQHGIAHPTNLWSIILGSLRKGCHSNHLVLSSKTDTERFRLVMVPHTATNLEWTRLLRQAFRLSHCDRGFALLLAGRSRGGSF